LLVAISTFSELPSALLPIDPWMWLAPLTAMALSLSVAWQQLVQRNGGFNTSGVSEIAGRCCHVLSGFLGGVLLPSALGLMTTIIFGAAGKMLWLVTRGVSISRDVIMDTTHVLDKSIKRLALSTSVSNAISLASGLIPLLYIADRYGANAVGQYGLVISTLYLPTSVIGQAIGQVFYQRAAKAHANGDSFHALLKETSVNLLKVAVPVFFGAALVAPYLYPFIFGSEWEVAGDVARLMSAAAFVGFISVPLDRSSLIVNAWWYLSVWHLLRAASVMAVALVSRAFELDFMGFVGLLSLQGVAVYALDWCCSSAFSKRGTNRKPDWRNPLRGRQT